MIKSTSNNIQKTIYLESGININIPTISFNTMGHQISIYAPNVIIKGFYDTSFIIPSTFCEIECDVCSENKCLECNWGFNSNHKCIKEPISIPAFMVGKGTKYSNSYTLATYLNNPKPLRSSTWSILFTMQNILFPCRMISSQFRKLSSSYRIFFLTCPKIFST